MSSGAAGINTGLSPIISLGPSMCLLSRAHLPHASERSACKNYSGISARSRVRLMTAWRGNGAAGVRAGAGSWERGEDGSTGSDNSSHPTRPFLVERKRVVVGDVLSAPTITLENRIRVSRFERPSTAAFHSPRALQFPHQ